MYLVQGVHSEINININCVSEDVAKVCNCQIIRKTIISVLSYLNKGTSLKFCGTLK